MVIGTAGVGKTYLCSALLAELHDKVSSIRAYDERKFLRLIRLSIGSSSNGDYLHYMQTLIDDDIIILDDIGSSGHTDWREEVLTDAIDYRYEEMSPTIITSNLSKKEFYDVYGQRISSRLFATENTIIDLFNMHDLRQEGK